MFLVLIWAFVQMKIDPISIVLNENLVFGKKFYLLSGNETTFIQHLKKLIVSKYCENDNYKIERIKNITSQSSEVGLFEKKSLFLIEDLSKVSEDILDNQKSNEDIFIFVSENSPKINKLKSLFNKRKDSFLIDCYELSKESKTKILNKRLLDMGHKISDTLYWLLIEKLDNKYVFFDNELNKLSNLKGDKIQEDQIRRLISEKTEGFEKLFFEISGSNKRIINLYNEKIKESKDVDRLYYISKQYCSMIINHDDERSFENSIPKYLFREKEQLISIYKRYNYKKKKLLLSLLSKTELSIRSERSLAHILGLRFLLNLRKLTIS